MLNPPKKKPERADFGLPEHSLISADNIGAFRWLVINLLKDTMDYMNFSDITKQELNNVNWIGILQSKVIDNKFIDFVQKITGASDAWMEALQKEQAYYNAKKYFESHTNWKNSRNKKRAELEEKFKFDCKHASHLVRLCRQGKEILETGKLNVFREDKEELKSIRNGAWTYDQLEEFAEQIEKEITELYEKSKLPREPKRTEIDKLCVEIIE